MKTILPVVAMATAPKSSSSSSQNGGQGGGEGRHKKIERQGLERRAPRARPRRRIRPIIVTNDDDDENDDETGTGDDFDDFDHGSNKVDEERRDEDEEQQKKKKIPSLRKKKKTTLTTTLEERVEVFASDPLSALASINRIAIGAVDELMVERKGNPSKLLEALSRNAPRLLLMEDNRNGGEEMARELEMELERLEKKGAKATREVRETLVKPNVDGETYERLFAYPGEDDESEDDEDEDDEDDSEGFYDASKDTGSDEEVAKAASDIADALSGMDLADLYAEKKEDESKGKDEGGRRLNVIAESDSRKVEKEGISQEAVEYAIEENMSNVVMETATVSATRRRVASATTASMTTPTTTSEISNKYYGSNDVMEQEQEQQEEEKKQTMDSVVKDDSSYLQKINGEWKRDDQLDESKLMDLFEMNQLFRAANSALTQLNVGASTSEFSLKASYGIISINESYAYDEEVRQNRRDARSGTQFGRATLDARSESITLDSRWTEPLEGTMTETFTVENNRLLRKAKVTLLQSQETWEGVYEYKRV